MTASCLLCARLVEGTGNFITAHRLLSIFVQIGFDAFLINTDEITEEEIIEKVQAQSDGSICVWFHAFRAGQYLIAIPENLIRKHIVILGGTDVNEMLDHEERGVVIREALSRADAITAFNACMFDRVPAQFQGKCVCIPQAVVTSSQSDFNLRQQINANDSTFVVLQVAGFRQVKDPSFAVETVCARPDTTLVIIGAPLDEEVTRSMKELEHQFENLVLFDVMPHEDLLQCIRQCDCAINTSLSEGMCNFILESMALGAPVVARKNEGNENLLQDNCGLLFETEDDLTTCLNEIQNSSEDIVTNAKAKIQNFFSEDAEFNGYHTLVKNLH